MSGVEPPGGSRPDEGDSLPRCVVLGMMSGTSLDGIDAVQVALELQEGRLHWDVLRRESTPYSRELRVALERAIDPQLSSVDLLTQLHWEVGHAYADLARRFDRSDLVAISGQTVYHIPRADAERGWRTKSTLQLGEAAVVTERLRAPVMSDFRASDMAAGGQGAPLVPFADHKLYASPGTARAVHNLGGISNLTYLPADGDDEGVLAFDTGPANCLIDEAMTLHYDRAYDADGAVAASGRADPDVLERLLAVPYLELEPPKTTGREVFRLPEFARCLECLEPADVVATLTKFSAVSAARAYERWIVPRGLDEVLVAGGGALNPTLMAMLREALPVRVRTFEECGWNSKDREALAFAVMGYYALHGRPNVLPSATGAQRPVVAGRLSFGR